MKSNLTPQLCSPDRPVLVKTMAREVQSFDSSRDGRILLRGQFVEIIPLDAKLVLGRASGMAVQLNDPTVSHQHASIEKETAGYRLTDLESRAGLFVNGRRVFVHDLILGDQVQIGPFH